MAPGAVEAQAQGAYQLIMKRGEIDASHDNLIVAALFVPKKRIYYATQPLGAGNRYYKTAALKVWTEKLPTRCMPKPTPSQRPKRMALILAQAVMWASMATLLDKRPRSKKLVPQYPRIAGRCSMIDKSVTMDTRQQELDLRIPKQDLLHHTLGKGQALRLNNQALQVKNQALLAKVEALRVEDKALQLTSPEILHHLFLERCKAS